MSNNTMDSKFVLQLYRRLRAHNIKPDMFNDEGNVTNDPEEASRLYIKSPNMMITVDSNTVTINKGSRVKYADIKPLIDTIKTLTKDYLMDFNFRTFGKSVKPKDFSNKAEDATLTEDYKNYHGVTSFTNLQGGKRTSYKTLDNKRGLIIKHNCNVQKNPNKRKNPCSYESIYVKNGYERIHYPVNYIIGAMAFARHLVKEGSPTDQVADAIKKMSVVAFECKKIVKILKEYNEGDYFNTIDLLDFVKDNFERKLKQTSRTIRYYPAKQDIENEFIPLLHDQDNDYSKLMLPKDERLDQYEETLAIAQSYLENKDMLGEEKKSQKIEEQLVESGLVDQDTIDLTNLLEFDTIHDRLLFVLNESIYGHNYGTREYNTIKSLVKKVQTNRGKSSKKNFGKRRSQGSKMVNKMKKSARAKHNK